MLTESGDGIRYVFLLSAGLRPFILHVGVVVNPFTLRGNSWDLQVDGAAMTLGQSLMATSYEVSTSGWTVCYSSRKSRNSGIAIS